MAYERTYSPCDDCQYNYSSNGQDMGMCEMCEFNQLLEADVVPRSEVEEMQKSNDTAYDKLRSLYKEAITEHSNQVAELMVKLEQAQAEKDNLIATYEACMRTYAEQLFEEIEETLTSLDKRYMLNFNPKQAWGVRGAMAEIAELKKKHIGE